MSEISLGEVLTFDKRAFMSDDEGERAVCDLVLALAAASNDLKDVYSLHVAIHNLSGTPRYADPFNRGELAGQKVAAMRALSGVLFELTKLLHDHRKPQAHPLFLKALAGLGPAGESSWAVIQEAAEGVWNRRLEESWIKSTQPSGSDALRAFARALYLARNRVSFHYDPSMIGAGYRARFTGTRPVDIPLIADGESMAATRFLFTDAALETYLDEEGLPDATKGQLGVLIENVAVGLRELVMAFIVMRTGGRFEPVPTWPPEPDSA